MKISVPIGRDLREFREAALIRLAYLNPDWSLALSEEGVSAEVSDQESDPHVQREVRYAIYREKIY